MNSELILMVTTLLFAVIAKYFGSKASLLGAAAQSLVDLQQEFLNDIRDGIISQQELTALLAKVQAASAALKAAIEAFQQPIPATQKLAIVFGFDNDLKSHIATVNAQTQGMKVQRMGRR
jgi:hypothetical protein